MSMLRRIRRNMAKQEFETPGCLDTWRDVWKKYLLGRSADPTRRPHRSMKWIGKAIDGKMKLYKFLNRLNPSRYGWLGMGRAAK